MPKRVSEQPLGVGGGVEGVEGPTAPGTMLQGFPQWLEQ